jgi:hypothetical protein
VTMGCIAAPSETMAEANMATLSLPGHLRCRKGSSLPRLGQRASTQCTRTFPRRG